MNKIKTKIKERLSDCMDWMEYGLRRIYGKPTMMKQFIIVLILGSFISVVSIYSLVSSIYNMGKRDAQTNMMEIKHAGNLELPNPSDSINLLKQKKYEYKQSNGRE